MPTQTGLACGYQLNSYGNGLAALIRHIRAIGPNRARSANTTASLCAINMSSAAARVQLRALTFARPTAISFNPINGGNSWESVWHAIFRERENSFCG